MTQELTVRRTDDRGLAIAELETRFAMAVRQRDLLEAYIKDRLKPSKHFYTVPDGQKPGLTKEGAELICLPHNLKPRYCILSGPEQPPMDESPYQITVNCELMNGDKFGGQGLGSASSMTTKKTGERIQRQRDPGLRHNATLKMACKSAYIAACLNATAASEFFTQDMEDHEGAGDSGDSIAPHFCKEHNTAFFKKGKMKNFAHPIGDTGQWCNEPVTDDSDLWPEEERERDKVKAEVIPPVTTPEKPQPAHVKPEGPSLQDSDTRNGMAPKALMTEKQRKTLFAKAKQMGGYDEDKWKPLHALMKQQTGKDRLQDLTCAEADKLIFAVERGETVSAG